MIACAIWPIMIAGAGLFACALAVALCIAVAKGDRGTDEDRIRRR